MCRPPRGPFSSIRSVGTLWQIAKVPLHFAFLDVMCWGGCLLGTRFARGAEGEIRPPWLIFMVLWWEGRSDYGIHPLRRKCKHSYVILIFQPLSVDKSLHIWPETGPRCKTWPDCTATKSHRRQIIVASRIRNKQAKKASEPAINSNHSKSVLAIAPGYAFTHRIADMHWSQEFDPANTQQLNRWYSSRLYPEAPTTIPMIQSEHGQRNLSIKLKLVKQKNSTANMTHH